MWEKLKFYFALKSRKFERGSSAKESDSISMSSGGRNQGPLNLQEEYKANLRTKSFIDLYTIVHPQNENENQNQNQTSPLTSRVYSTLPGFVLDPSQESLTNLEMPPILLEYFDTMLEACVACGDILASLDKARRQHRYVRRLLIRLSKVEAGHLDDRPGQAMFAELERKVEFNNPLSTGSLSLFHRAHARYHPLVFRLTSAHKKILRRVRFISIAKKISILLVFKCILKELEQNETAESQMDMAVKGAYIVERDFDTVSRMVQRAHDEIEHGRNVAKMALEERERQLLIEVAKEVVEGEEELMELLEELEEHVYLCLITINRSRRLVAEEITGRSNSI
ncbi:hypothetical protein LUZ60_007107 [Juncus effusus]|nr:hypothetical protein LUZ60_007107 [Juncus effusus]